MNFTLKIFLLFLLVLQLIFIIHIVKKDKLSMKYASLWVLLIFILGVVAIFPDFLFWLSEVLGFEKTSNMVFLLGFFFLFYLIFVMMVSISSQNEKIRLLVQELSLLKERVDKNGKKD